MNFRQEMITWLKSQQAHVTQLRKQDQAKKKIQQTSKNNMSTSGK